MATLPDDKMRDAATQIIELLGDPKDFQRKNSSGTWEESATGVKVHIQPRSSYLKRVFSGIEDVDDFKCFAPETSDIKKGDRTQIGGIYYVTDNLDDMGTHIEFGLKETDEKT